VSLGSEAKHFKDVLYADALVNRSLRLPLLIGDVCNIISMQHCGYCVVCTVTSSDQFLCVFALDRRIGDNIMGRQL